MERMENFMFNFRIIDTPDGNQVIRKDLKTPYNALTPLQMVEYVEMEAQLAYMDMMERKARKETDRKQKFAWNLLRRLACLCGLV